MSIYFVPVIALKAKDIALNKTSLLLPSGSRDRQGTSKSVENMADGVLEKSTSGSRCREYWEEKRLKGARKVGRPVRRQL